MPDFPTTSSELPTELPRRECAVEMEGIKRGGIPFVVQWARDGERPVLGVKVSAIDKLTFGELKSECGLPLN